VPLAALAALAALAIPMGMRVAFQALSLPLDPTAGVVQPLGRDALAQAVGGRRALVVGGTRGIGRHVALELARLGAHVSIAGRSAGESHMRELVEAAGGANLSAPASGAYAFDLLTVRGCVELVEALQANEVKIDLLVMTVGMWPDLEEPRTKEGHDKVLMLDVIARFIVLDGLARGGDKAVLQPDARVLSVLASTQWLPVPSQLDVLHAWVRGDDGYRFAGVHHMPTLMAVAAVSHDAMLQHAAHTHTHLRVVGTHPGVVPTDVFTPTVPAWSVPLLKRVITWLPMSLSPVKAGLTQIQIAVSPNVETRKVTYFNHDMEGRKALARAYDARFQKWLWNHLTEVRRRGLQL